MSNIGYINSILKMREARQNRMLSTPLNWFSLVGLFPLNEGENPFGNNPGNAICLDLLPDGCRGEFLLKNGSVILNPPPISSITVNGKPPQHRPLRSDVDGEPDLVECGRVAIRLIKRGEKFFLRVWDLESPNVKFFNGLNYFEVNPVYCITAEFIQYNPPRLKKVMDVIGTERGCIFPGEARFSLGGIRYSLIAEDDGDELLFSFTDQTRQDETYPGGRFLNTPKPEHDRVILDFNLAINWPCAYTPFATCPLPLLENHLAVRIEAGEKKFK